jgi:hypothetical protein
VRDNGHMAEIETDLWIYWAQLAARRTAQARVYREVAVRDPVIGPAKISAALEELPEVLSAVTSAAFAVDGFAGAVRQFVPTAPRRSRPKRAYAVLETLKDAFLIGNSTPKFQIELVWLYDLRDRAVHSSIRVEPTYLHPSGISLSEISREFGLENAERALGVLDAVLSRCLAAPRPTLPALSGWALHRAPRLRMALSG